MSPTITAADPAATAGASLRPAPRRLTGLTPSGQLHLGSLLGAIRPMVSAQAHTAPATASSRSPTCTRSLWTTDHTRSGHTHWS